MPANRLLSVVLGMVVLLTLGSQRGGGGGATVFESVKSAGN